MLLVHTPKLTNRIGYTLNVLLQHVLHIEFSITTNADFYLAHEGPKFNYGQQRLGDGLFIKSVDLMFSTSIEDQDIRGKKEGDRWRLFPVYGKDLDFDFDLLAATFYVVSRYEEYLPHLEDEHGRFVASESLAFKMGFLDEPVVEQWAQELQEGLARRYPNQTFSGAKYRYVQTVDIDSAWCYMHKGTSRTLMGTLRDLVQPFNMANVGHRWKVLLKREADPYDTFDFIIDHIQKSPGAHLLFFVLMADYSQYDKPISYINTHMRSLVQHLGDHAKMGIHPGYHSLENPKKVDVEVHRLEEVLHRTIVRSRYHFLRLRLPESYRILLHAGIKHDYTMGYADAVGFRAGISTPYPFFDLETDLETELLIHPFCVMDTTMKKYLKMSPEEGTACCIGLIEKLRKVGGTFCNIVHNQNICDNDEWRGWRESFVQVAKYATP